MAPKSSQKGKVTAAAKKLSQTAHKRHERNFRFHPRVFCNKILRERVLFTKIFERFSPIFSQLHLCHFHGLHQTIKDRQTHMYSVSHVLDPMLVRFKMTPKLAGALRLQSHITTTHSAMKVRRLSVLCTAHETLVGRMEIQHAAMQQLTAAVFLGSPLASKLFAEFTESYNIKTRY